MSTVHSFPQESSPLRLEPVNRILELAKQQGAELAVVGGFLRDALIGGSQFDVHAAKDIDFVVSGKSALDFAQSYATASGGHFVLLDRDNDCARVVLAEGKITFDFAGQVGSTLEEDLGRRDFTINALAWQCKNPLEIIDLYDGVGDLSRRVIRAISEKTFLDDPLRVLRAFRFASTLQFSIEKQTLQYCQKHSHLLSEVAAERINVELFTTLSGSCTELLGALAECRLLEVIFPELVDTHRVTANDYHHLGLFEHSLETVPQLEKRMSTVDEWVKESLFAEVSFGVSRLAATKLACLLHDIGKPETWQINEDGRHTFYAHDVLGAQMCEVIAQRMKWSKPVTKLIVKLVKWHLRPGALFHQGPSTERAINRFYRQVGDDLPELIMLAFADFGATRGPGMLDEKRVTLEAGFYELLNGYRIFEAAQKSRVKLLDGNDVISLLQILPGPLVGRIFAAVEEAQEFKEIANRAEAEDFVRNLDIMKLAK